MGRFFRFLNLIVVLGLGFAIGVGVSWLNSQGDAGGPGVQWRSAESFKITGMIDVRPELKDRLKPTDPLVITVTRPGSQVPLAVKKVSQVSFPFLYTVGPEDLVGEDRFLRFVPPKQVNLTARVGNLIGSPTENPVSLPTGDLHILIDRVAEDDHVVE